MTEERKSYSFSMTKFQLKQLLDKIKDLANIDVEVIVKIDNYNLLVYTLIGERNNVNAFKSFIFNTSTLMSFEDEIEGQIKYIIRDGKKFERDFKNFLEYEPDNKCVLHMNDEEYADNLVVNNGILKLSSVGGDPQGKNMSIDIEKIKSAIDIKNSNFKFDLDKKSFERIKKLSLIELAESDPLYLTILNKKLSIGQTTWNLEVCDIDYEDDNISFPRKYFNSLVFPKDATTVEVYVFDTFLMCDNNETSLLVALEMSI